MTDAMDSVGKFRHLAGPPPQEQRRFVASVNITVSSTTALAAERAAIKILESMYCPTDVSPVLEWQLVDVFAEDTTEGL